MKSKRLTKAIKEIIIEKMCREFFKPREEAEDKAKVALADDAYSSLYSADDKKLMAEAPQGAFRYRTSIGLKFHNYSYHSYELSKAMPFFSSDDGRTVYFKEDSEFIRRFLTIKEREVKIREDRKALTASTNAILDSVTTIPKLLSIWPEVEAYLPTEDIVENLPALPVGDLNALIANLKVHAGEACETI